MLGRVRNDWLHADTRIDHHHHRAKLSAKERTNDPPVDGRRTQQSAANRGFYYYRVRTLRVSLARPLLTAENWVPL